VSQNNNFAYHI